MQIGLFDEELRMDIISKLGDSLVRLNRIIQWEIFRPVLYIKPFARNPKEQVGAYVSLLMFKILILQRIYNLSDDQTEFQINDRRSFMRFLGLHIKDRVPDVKTNWRLRDTLTKANVMRELFDTFSRQLEGAHIITRTGTIVDATFVDAPRQRNTREENARIKTGEIPEEWKAEENSNKLRQKDTDARWTKKGNETHYGYKDHTEKCSGRCNHHKQKLHPAGRPDNRYAHGDA